MSLNPFDWVYEQLQKIIRKAKSSKENNKIEEYFLWYIFGIIFGSLMLFAYIALAVGLVYLLFKLLFRVAI